MPAVGVLDHVHRKKTNGVDAPLIQFDPLVCVSPMRGCCLRHGETPSWLTEKSATAIALQTRQPTAASPLGGANATHPSDKSHTARV
jgi:hypothetical protein